MIRTITFCLALAALGPTQNAEWSTHRGGPARTGNIDGKPGPMKTPKVLWTHKAAEQFVASLVASGDRLYLPALGAFNSGAIHSLDLAEKAEKRISWSKSAPHLRVPSVCAPALSEGKLVLGEGMHQTDGAGLLCLRATDGRALWRLNVSGDLVHLEGSPTIAGGRVYVGAGSGGVLCVDLNKVTLEGKDVTLAEAEAKNDAKWKVLLAAYEADKKKDPDFAIPPNELSLPQTAPKVAWEQGKGAWHVDGPTAVVEGRVLAGSAFLDVEKKGERVLACMNAEDGKLLWKTPLKYNPWGGPTVAGGRVLVSCSSIRYDPQQVSGARGEIVALKLADGSVEWRREIDAGVLGSVAVAGDLAIFTDTAGRVQALDAKTGAPRWTAPGTTPFFAAAVLSKDAVYVVDLKGGIQALGLADGKQIWKLDLAAATGQPGMVYGSPALHRGCLYVATTNLEGEGAGKPTLVACIGAGE
jgi:outer membrane protein assembly factor BamB